MVAFASGLYVTLRQAQKEGETSLWYPDISDP